MTKLLRNLLRQINSSRCDQEVDTRPRRCARLMRSEGQEYAFGMLMDPVTLRMRQGKVRLEEAEED